jgi:Arc/MetJ-type ribon-helix-helix transcriptional regulator
MTYTQVHTEQAGKEMKRLQITLEDELYQWLTKEIKALKFGSYSHAINYAIKQLKEDSSKQ